MEKTWNFIELIQNKMVLKIDKIYVSFAVPQVLLSFQITFLIIITHPTSCLYILHKYLSYHQL